MCDRDLALFPQYLPLSFWAGFGSVEFLPQQLFCEAEV